MKFSKIVLTGGPCAGKSTGMSWIQNAFTQMGYHVVFLPETATELVTAGIAPWNCGSNTDFQKCLMKLQIDKESLYDQAAKTIAQDKVLVVCDRGTCDNFAYMNQEERKSVMDFVGSNEVDLRGMDAVEAICVLDNYLDGAMRANLSSVRIIHGKGTGVLRKAVQDALKKNKHVKKYRLGVYGEGEDGVTIAEFG